MVELMCSCSQPPEGAHLWPDVDSSQLIQGDANSRWAPLQALLVLPEGLSRVPTHLCSHVQQPAAASF